MGVQYLDIHGWAGTDRKGQGPLAVLFVLLFIGTSFLPLMTPVPMVRAAVVKDPYTDPDGLMWGPPVKVTRNNFDDQNPSMRLDPSGNAVIVYQQSSTDYMLAKVSPPGNVLLSEKRLETGYIPTQYQIMNESTPQSTKFFDLGPDGSIHIVWTEAGLLDNKYQKFDPQGEPLTGVIPMNQITDLSRLPNVGVGENGRAYIAFENEGTAWIQMTYVDQEGYLRSPTLIGRPGENVAFTMAPDGSIHLFYRSLGADPRIFYVKLDRDRKPLVPVGAVLSNWPLIANAYSSMPTMTVTPNGHVHLLISNTTVAPHPIYYIELDENGTPVTDFVTVADGAYNYGDIAGDPDNGAYIAWDDVKDGEVHYRHSKDGVLGKEVVLTSTGGKARHPGISSDRARGDLHLVYVDITGGEGALFYRYANAYRIVMDIPELDRALWVHPGRGQIGLNVTVGNIGEIPVRIDFTYSVDYHGLQGHNWSFKFPTSEVDIGAGLTTKSLAVLMGPNQGDPGEGIDISITATPEGASYKAVTLAFRSTLVIDRTISLSGPPKWPLMHKVETLPLNLTNGGDLQETVDLTVVGGQPGWAIGLDRGNATLGPGVSRTMTLQVTLPDGEAPDTVVPVSIIAVSRWHPTTTDRLNIVLVAYPSVFLAPPVGNVTVELASGGSASTHPLLWNQGLSDGVFDVTANVVSAHGEWDVSVLTPRLTVHANQTALMELRVGAPVLAGAGLGLVVDLLVTEENGKAWETVRVEAWVIEKRALSVTGGGNATVNPGQSAVLPVHIENLGNSERQVELSVLPLPIGWRWQYGEEMGLSFLTIGPFSSRSVELFVTPPFGSMPLVKRIEGIVTGEGETYKFYADVTVRPVHGVSVETSIPFVKAALGANATFFLMVTNLGTATDNFTLFVDDLPQGITASFGEDASIMLSPARIEPCIDFCPNARLVLKLPDHMKGTDFGFWAGARSSNGEVSVVDLLVELRLPDLRIRDVVFDDKGIKDGNVRKVTVVVANDGDADASNVIVDVNGMEGTINVTAGHGANVTFDVKFHAGDGAIQALIDPGNGIQERREDNNDYMVQVQVGQKAAVPGFDAQVVIVTTVITVIVSIRRSRLIRKITR